jgi:hypothetical protein
MLALSRGNYLDAITRHLRRNEAGTGAGNDLGASMRAKQ